MKLYLVYFSPTHTTKKIVATVGKVFFERLLCRAQLVDLTNIAARSRSYAFAEDDVVVFGAPVYGGRLPQLLVPVLQNMQGGGARAVVLSVYGNRDYDDALLETADLFAERGFRVCAAAAFIGEHSYSSAVAKNRPDAEDLIAATTFGVAAFANVEQGVACRKPVRGARPYKQLSGFMLAPKAAPAVDAEKCVRCGACIAACPAANIGADLSDQGRCISCAACVKFCRQGARSFTDPAVLAAKGRLESSCTARRQPEFFI